MNQSGDIEVANSQVGNIFLVCLILIIGIGYNLYSNPHKLYEAFTPFNLSIIYGQTLVILTFILAFITGVRFWGFLRSPIIARVVEEGLYLNGIGVVPWERLNNIWFGTYLGRQQGSFGTFMHVEFLHPIETKKLKLKTGIYADQATKSGRFTKVKYWIPFVLPNNKKQFIDTANLYNSAPNKKLF